MKISGVMPLRNAVKLGYPFELAIRSLRRLCDELVILVDPTSEDDTVERVRMLAPDLIVESIWDMSNHKGHTNCEISVQTAKACVAASGDWIFSLQADEILHELEISNIRCAVDDAKEANTSAYALRRLYFYGSLETTRRDWTQYLVRLFQRNRWKPDVDGAMKFEPIVPTEKVAFMPHGSTPLGAEIYHYSRIGDPQQVAERVRNLDGFFHEPNRITSGVIPPYNFGELRKLDTYVIDAPIEIAQQATLRSFPIDGHPLGVREYFGQ